MYYIPNNLLNTGSDAKTVKGEKLGWYTHIMYMSPFNQNSKGINVCPMASNGCAQACLFVSGRGAMSNVIKGRTNKTEYFLQNRIEFLQQLDKELASKTKSAVKKGKKICVRLNGTSDISWEKFKVRDNKTIFELYPSVQFYDYTKNHHRFKKELPSNYYLTFSRSEENEAKALELLSKGVNVAVVFDKLPDTYKGYKVIDGDLSDLRFLDEQGVIVGLKYKRNRKKGADNNAPFVNGFALRLADISETVTA